MKIIILDGHALNPGDLSWGDLKTLGDCTIHPRTAADELLARAADAEILLTNKTPLKAGTIAALPALKYIGVLATGYNIVDTEAARARSIIVTNIPGYSTPAVAQHTFALLLELTNHVGRHAAAVRRGDWVESPDFCFWQEPLVELADLTLGIIGYGEIGAAVACIAQAFGMHVCAYTRTPKADVTEVEFLPLAQLLARSDAVTLHCPLTAATRHLLDAAALAQMKPGAFLVNTSRGPLIDDTALAAALQAGALAGAAVDVLAQEPPKPDNPLLTAPNCLVTPHVAWAAGAARRRLLHLATENLRAFLNGSATNVVS